VFSGWWRYEIKYNSWDTIYTGTNTALEFRAQWYSIYQVYFSAEDLVYHISSPNAIQPIETHTGKAMTLPSCTPPVGYVFVNWVTANGGYVGTAGSTYDPHEEVTLYPVWKKIVTIIYDKVESDPNIVLNKTQDTNVYVGATVTLATISRVGYDFLGWYTVQYPDLSNLSLNRKGDSGGLYVVLATDPSVLTLYAGWRQQHVVEFVDAVGGNPVAKYCSQGGHIDLPGPGTGGNARYYNFEGWYSGNTLCGVAGQAYYATGNIVLTAKRTQVGGPIHNMIQSQSTQVGEWRVTDAGAGKYNIILRFTHPDIAIELEGGASNVRIGNHAFDGAASLTSLSAESLAGVSAIGSHAFSGCVKLRYIRMGGSVLSIGSYAFSGCEKMATVEMGQNTQSIGERAFDGGLDNVGVMTIISVPQSVTFIGSEAFVSL